MKYKTLLLSLTSKTQKDLSLTPGNSTPPIKSTYARYKTGAAGNSNRRLSKHVLKHGANSQ
jgi:hypothetical protein